MVDVDQRTGGLTPANAAGLRRLCSRASAAASSSSSSSTSPAPLDGLARFSFSPLADSLVSHLRSAGVPLLPGLTAAEISRAEAALGLPIPPDLRAVLSLAVPSGAGFPDWRSIPRLRSSLCIPFAAASLQIYRGSLRPRHRFPPSSSDPRDALRRAPPIIPLFDRCYLPALPCLAGNPVFLVEDRRVSIHATDISDFFTRQASSPSPDLLPPPAPPPRPPPLRRSMDAVAGRNPRWIEFWSDAASSDRRRRSSASSAPAPSSPPDLESFVEIRPPRLPNWVGEYLDGLGEALRGGGWGESDVSEMVHLSQSGSRCCSIDGGGGGGGDDEVLARDSRAALESLLLKADRHSESLRRAGWSSDEVCDALGFFDCLLLTPQRRKREKVKLPPELAAKIGRLAEAVVLGGK